MTKPSTPLDNRSPTARRHAERLARKQAARLRSERTGMFKARQYKGEPT